ncbi:hypothetical protein MRX96_036265 [Rhipicephalus microplus]
MYGSSSLRGDKTNSVVEPGLRTALAKEHGRQCCDSGVRQARRVPGASISHNKHGAIGAIAPRSASEGKERAGGGGQQCVEIERPRRGAIQAALRPNASPPFSPQAYMMSHATVKACTPVTVVRAATMTFDGYTLLIGIFDSSGAALTCRRS